MGVRKKYVKGRVERRLRRMNNISLLLICVMLLLVAYDSLVHKTPLYYLGFLMVGYFIGGLFRKTIAVRFETDTDSFTITTNLVYIILTVLLIIIRLAFGRQLLEAFDVVYASDALYLFFIASDCKWI